MAVDARRRFTFGMASEGTSLVLWYNNRSTLVCSRPLDIIKDKEHLLRVLLSFAFAPDVDMGLDPSVELVEDPGGCIYNIKVNKTQYKTLRVLQDQQADVLLGRGARIFKVKKVDDTEDQIYVLKDFWLKKDQKPEHKIYEDIIQDVRCLYSEQDANTVKQHLVTPVDNTIVTINGVEDDTGTSMMRYRTLEPSEDVQQPICTPSPDETRSSSTYTSSSDIEDDSDAISDIKSDVPDPEKTCHRLHYRVVFKEYATPIDQVKTMGDVFTVLADLIKVLRFLHGSGWVHRDVSTGNVYLYKGRGLLGDFEYAKTTADHSQPEVRIGTIDFMAVEVMKMAFLFQVCECEKCANQRQPHPKPPPTHVDLNTPLNLLHVSTYEEVPFRYNAIHDIESAWWVGLWTLFFRKPKGYSESSEMKRIRHRETTWVFPGTLEYLGRHRYIDNAGMLPESVQPWISNKCSSAVWVFDYVWSLLQEIYLNLEKTFPDGHQRLSEKVRVHQNGHHDAFPGGPEEGIHTPIQDMFLRGKHAYDSDPHKVELVSYGAEDEPADLETRKRKRSDDQAPEE
ncbi:hypothetical protein EI94DRAFT_1809947 [Lactarius quietus]|nr:hypothetical protein EI94DRAFT_1809947 [Lactarius quietus]